MQSSRELFESIARGESAACDAESGPRAELEARYRPMLASFARRVGLETGRIDAAVDRALLHLFESLGEESPLSELGSSERLFRTAGMQIADTSLSASDSLQTLSGLEEAWRSEWRRALVRFALQSLSASADTDHRALQAFEMHVIERRQATEVAKELGMSPTAVHGAKNLLLGKLQTRMSEVETQF